MLLYEIECNLKSNGHECRVQYTTYELKCFQKLINLQYIINNNKSTVYNNYMTNKQLGTRSTVVYCLVDNILVNMTVHFISLRCLL